MIIRDAITRLAKRFPLTSMIAGLIVWALHFVLVYSTVGLACERPELLASGPMFWLLMAWTVLALLAVLVIGAAGIVAWRDNRGRDGGVEGRRYFMGRLATLLALLGLVAVLMTALPIFFMQPPCIRWGPL
jgi:amino acid transporter